MSARRMLVAFFAIAVVFLSLRLPAQQPDQGQSQSQGQDGMSGMDMSKMGHMHHDAAENPDAARSANDSMSHERLEMSAHMFMTALRPANTDDDKRAEQILATLRPSIEKYKDYRAAIADGYQIFLPKIPQSQYHFTNWRYAFEAEFVFNAAHPTSLLYKRTHDGYQLLGAMYTAPKKDTEDQLNERVPLSVARWHKHINFCMPAKGQQWWQVDWKKFGMGGSIASEDACNEAGGRWVPQIYGWMVHVYPYESDPEKIWAH